MNELKTYEGQCHCGKVRFDVKVDLGGQIVSCNCSFCSRAGALMAFVGADQVTFRAGSDVVLTDYQFGKKHIHHEFCPGCGVRPFSRGTAPDGRAVYAINVRCLDGVDLDALKVTKVDGRSL
ncbi:GFA family protein [Vitiosangium sp. GDMCC 1.1324]|uniref:GFA family protein n=1 Tax=Vitiosangium sp. (strain GDMCC 1.1324) TaxID=2138576 RepID=UPI000D38A030|nr:GFA family protein [Vitiosangium sp. GDMCC 1.1324]PTL77076.1 GFA family protein [Vitiosangium sp. GDMCC 1.1324]